MIPTDTGHKDLRCNFKFYFVPTVSVIDFFLYPWVIKISLNQPDKNYDCLPVAYYLLFLFVSFSFFWIGKLHILSGF